MVKSGACVIAWKRIGKGRMIGGVTGASSEAACRQRGRVDR